MTSHPQETAAPATGLLECVIRQYRKLHCGCERAAPPTSYEADPTPSQRSVAPGEKSQETLCNISDHARTTQSLLRCRSDYTHVHSLIPFPSSLARTSASVSSRFRRSGGTRCMSFRVRAVAITSPPGLIFRAVARRVAVRMPWARTMAAPRKAVSVAKLRKYHCGPCLSSSAIWLGL